jgi:two-component sensor histidine kinase
VNGGRVDVGWSRDGHDLKLRWRESGGPPVAPPTHEGFGSRLIGQLGRSMQGEIRRDWRPEGLAVDMRLRLDAEPPLPSA